jgi:hypothetical protein
VTDSSPFVAQLRTRRPPINLAEPGSEAIILRVQAAELWEAVRVNARPDTPVAEVKQRVVSDLFPNQQYPDDFVLKLLGWEILDERSSLKDAGVRNGSILLLTYRRRRPVR